MIGLLDLKTISTDMGEDLVITHRVEAPNGDRYILMSSDVTEDDFEKLDVMTMFFYMAYPQYMKEVSVFRGDEDWKVAGECGPECGEGMCTRRIAEDRESGDIGRAYELLVNYLNA